MILFIFLQFFHRLFIYNYSKYCGQLIFPIIFFVTLAVVQSNDYFFQRRTNQCADCRIWNSIDKSPSINWTRKYDAKFAEFALDFAAAAYSEDPTPCLKKNGAVLEKITKVPCDFLNNKCWAYIARNDEWIVFTVRGTRTHVQLITELVETMSAPKKKFPGGGSVQRYFYTALQALWNSGFGIKMRELKIQYPKAKILFTGHSLGGAICSLASSLFVFENFDLPGFDLSRDVQLITFGQPRVGNFDFAQEHDLRVPNSWRLIHRYDIVAHLPYCIERILSHKCTPLYNHGPFHHGTEIWYPETMNSNDSIFRICNGLPINEDNNCSNGYYKHYDVDDHLIYFGKDVDFYGNSGCRINTRMPPAYMFYDSSEEVHENKTKHWPRRKRNKKQNNY